VAFAPLRENQKTAVPPCDGPPEISTAPHCNSGRFLWDPRCWLMLTSGPGLPFTSALTLRRTATSRRLFSSRVVVADETQYEGFRRLAEPFLA
jgi:hypothetical protein